MLLLVSGWANRRQNAAIEYLREENRILREQLGGRKLRLTDDQRRRLSVTRAIAVLPPVRDDRGARTACDSWSSG